MHVMLEHKPVQAKTYMQIYNVVQILVCGPSLISNQAMVSIFSASTQNSTNAVNGLFS